MLRHEKEQIVAAVRDRLARAQTVVVADYHGLTVEQATEIRREFKRNACEYQVVKNRLVKHAFGDTPFRALGPLIEGMAGLAFGYQDAVAVAKVSAKVAKDVGCFRIKGGYHDGRLLDRAGVERLARMPGRDDARALLLSAIIGPARNMVGLLAAPMRDLLLVLKGRVNQLEEGK